MNISQQNPKSLDNSGINTSGLKNENEKQKSEILIDEMNSEIKKSNLFILELENLLAQGGDDNQIARWKKTILEEEEKRADFSKRKKTFDGFSKFINEGGTLPEMSGGELAEKEPEITAHDHDEDVAERIRAKYAQLDEDIKKPKA